MKEKTLKKKAFVLFRYFYLDLMNKKFSIYIDNFLILNVLYTCEFVCVCVFGTFNLLRILILL